MAAGGVEVLGRAGARDGQPFVLGPDGFYDVGLNRFLRELPSWGVRSPRSIEAYARDLLVFCRFLHDARVGKTIWEADDADLRAFKTARRRVDGFRVAAATSPTGVFTGQVTAVDGGV